jgi:hypothetical protein
LLQENDCGQTNGGAPRPFVGDCEGSWGGRETPSFFSRLGRVLE